MENNVLEIIIQKAKKENRMVNIYAHESPDGDAIASSKTLEKILQDNGINARYIVKSSRVNNRYSRIVGETQTFQGRVNRNDISVILDTSAIDHAENRLFSYSKPENTFVIDHHAKEGSSIEEALKLPTKNVYRNEKATSTCEMIAEMLKDTGKLNKEYATKLLVGLWTDTAKFRYIGENSLNSLSMLLDSGADFESVKSCLETKRFLSSEVGIAKALLNTKRIKVGNTYLNYFGLDNESVQSIEKQYRSKYIQKKIFKLLDIENTSLAVAVVENIPNNFFCEFRSVRDLGNVDVFSVAKEMGGGGHYHASGCTVKSDKGIDKVSKDVLTKLTHNALPSLVRTNAPKDTIYDIELKQILNSMDRFDKNLTPENFDKIQELISSGARYESDYEEKVSFETFMVRNSILTQIPKEQLRNRRIIFKLNRNFLDEMQKKYGASQEDVLAQIELFKELDIDYISMMTPDGKSSSIDSKGNIKKYQKESTQK